MRVGFYLFIDEAGDEGIDRVRPLDPGGSPEYFVMSGVLVQASRYQEVASFVRDLRRGLGIVGDNPIHFRNLDDAQKHYTVNAISDFRCGIVSIVSNKRNIRKYKNLKCQNKNFEVVRGRTRPKNENWFYNHTFRYLLERASSYCARYTKRIYDENRSIRIVFSLRSGFSYSQTKAYLHKLKVVRHRGWYPNNKRQIDWSVVDPSEIHAFRAKQEPGLQIADCVASAIYASIDEDWFGHVVPQYAMSLSRRFILDGDSSRDFGFTLLPQKFDAPLTSSQMQTIRAGGY